MANYENVNGLEKPILRDEPLAFAIHRIHAERFINDLLKVAVDEYNALKAERCKMTGESFTPEEYTRCLLEVGDRVQLCDRDETPLTPEEYIRYLLYTNAQSKVRVRKGDFYPLMMMLPVSAASERKPIVSAEGKVYMSIENVSLKTYIEKAISSFMYKDFFKDINLKKNWEDNRRKIEALTVFTVPRIIKAGNCINSELKIKRPITDVIEVLINPSELFSMMLSTSEKRRDATIRFIVKDNSTKFSFLVTTNR